MAQSSANSNPSKTFRRATDAKNMVINDLLEQKAVDYASFFSLYEVLDGPWEYIAKYMSDDLKVLSNFFNTSRPEENDLDTIGGSTCERTVHALILEIGGQLIVSLFNNEELARAANDAFRDNHDETFFGEVSSDVAAVSITENDPTHQILTTGFAYFFAYEWEGGFALALYPTREAQVQAELAFESKDEDGFSIHLIGMGIALLP